MLCESGFRYKNNSVAVVEKWGFYHCDSSNPIAFFNDGETVIDLDNVGTMYFISGDADRCKYGLNMMVEVMSPAQLSTFRRRYHLRRITLILALLRRRLSS
ncbi:hypothetical protein R6Q59_012999 [Mikania micrantha]